MTTSTPRSTDESSFAETALRLGGKSDEEARRMGAIDKADDQVERLFERRHQTTASPIHRAVWESSVPNDLFQTSPLNTPAEVQTVMDRSFDVVLSHRRGQTLLNEDGKIREEVLSDLGQAGYWGLLVDREYGGAGAPFSSFASFLTRMAMVDPTIAGLASVHGCIGAVDPIQAFGSPTLKREYLPKLASGQRLSAFALTEPCAGSDLTALRTLAHRDGSDFVVNGEKLFITNVVPGRTIGLVCLIDGQPAVLICDLPDRENDQFQLRRYGLYALRQTYNQGIIFRNFRVPVDNLLTPTTGNGLTVAYHGLNRGRVALCANAAGTMRLMMASMIPWAHFRVTYGEPIARRELVRRRLGRLAGLIVACDALVAWCSGLLDQGFRGEMECIVAKIFGSEAQKEAAVELFMKTHGGRSFLHGHMFGDNVHEYLAPCIYEGEGEMLGMGFFKSLIKHHGTKYFEPVGKALNAAGIARPSFLNPRHLMVTVPPALPYMGWMLRQWLPGSRPDLPAMPSRLAEHAEYALRQLRKQPREISAAMRKHMLKIADRQCRMSELSARVQKLVVIACTSHYAARQDDEILRRAADIACQDLRRELSGSRPEDGYFKAVSSLGEAIVEGGFESIRGVKPDEILMPYSQ